MINNSYINSNITSPNENSMIVHGAQGEFTPVSTQQNNSIQEPDENKEDHGTLSCWGSLSLFMKYSWMDIKRRRCHFCLAFCSVFITVLATLVVNTVISKGPIIFLTLNQARTGEIDSIIYQADNKLVNVGQYCMPESFMNYTRVVELYGTEQYNLAPRYHKCDVTIENEDYDLVDYRLMMWDTDRERDI